MRVNGSARFENGLNENTEFIAFAVGHVIVVRSI